MSNLNKNKKPPMSMESKGDKKPGSKPKNTKETIKRLVEYICIDKLKVTLILLFVIINTMCTLLGAYMIRPIINNYILPIDGRNPSLTGLVGALLLMGGILLMGVIAAYFQNRIMMGVSQKAVKEIRRDLFNKVQKLPVRFFDTNNHGDIMSRFTNDVDSIGEMLNNIVIQLFTSVITIIGTVILMLYTNVILALITIATVPIMIKLLSKISSKSRVYFKEQQESIGKLNGYVEETITGQKVVKVFCHEDVARSEFKELNVELREKQIKAQFFGGMIMPIMAQISTITYAVVACVGGILCLTSGFDIGGIAVFCNYSRQFGRPINELSNQINIIFSALAGAERVFNTMDKEPEVEDSKDAVELKDVKGRVVLENVTFGYNKDMTILKDISLYAQPGQKIAFVGSTGAGKTTITNLLTRFYDICEGKITIDDIPLMSIKKDSLRSSIAMVLQDTHLFTGTVMENIRYGRLDATDEEVIDAAKTASAHPFIRKLPDGYNTMLVGDGSNLSQGQRQLISIARASISKAPILILDEATSSVDTRTEKHIEHGMDRLMKDRTTFVIAHRLSTVRNSNAIMVLENGEIIERGEHDELVAQKGRYYELYTGLSELD